MPTSAPQPSASAPWVALPVILLGAFLAVLDFFVVNVALPSIGASLRMRSASLELVVAGYGVAYACALVAGGRLGDRHGRRPLYVAGMTAFTIASGLCGAAPTGTLLVAARCLQGLAAAVMVPQVLATIQASFVGADRQRALGLFGATLGAGTVGGRLVGGALVEADVAGLGWRAVFLINLPLGLVGIVAARRLLPETRAAEPLPVDVVGAVLLAATVVALLVPLAVGRELGWPVWCAACLVASPVAAVALSTWQRRAERRGWTPIVPPSLLRLPGVAAGLATTAVFFVGVGGFFLTTAVSLQRGLGLGPLEAGLTLVPFALAYAAGSLVARRVAARLGRRAIALGGLVLAVGLALASVQAARGYADLGPLVLAPSLSLVGLGQALVMIPLFGLVLQSLPPERAGVAGGVLTTTQQVSLAVGVAALGSAFFALVARDGWDVATASILAVEVLPALATALGARLLPTGLAG